MSDPINMTDRHDRAERLSPAVQAAYDAIEAQAALTARALIEASASNFALHPTLLDNIEPGLSGLSPRRMAARIAKLLADELAAPRRYMGFGGEVPLVNLKGAALYAEVLMQIEGTRS